MEKKEENTESRESEFAHLETILQFLHDLRNAPISIDDSMFPPEFAEERARYEAQETVSERAERLQSLHNFYTATAIIEYNISRGNIVVPTSQKTIYDQMKETAEEFAVLQRQTNIKKKNV